MLKRKSNKYWKNYIFSYEKNHISISFKCEYFNNDFTIYF